ncbi:hypothetical protein N9K45_00030 [bacterium]|nr:hypothetical protein [bacterium]
MSAAQALLEDEQQLFPQKRARVLQWVVDALIRSQKICRASASSSGNQACSAEPVHSALHWHLLAQLVPGSEIPVHADLACAAMVAADACASDGLLQPSQQQLLQHVLSVLTELRPVYFRPRVEAVRDVLSSLCALATRVLVSPCAAAPVVLQLCALAARMLTAALRQSSNMKRNFTVVVDILPCIVSLRGAVVDDAGRAELHGDAPELLAALDALLSAAMFRPEQLSDYHLAFAATRVHAAKGKAVPKKGARGLASYQSQLFKTLRKLVLAAEQHVQVASCAAVSWVFVCFVSAMHGEPESDSAPKGMSTKISAKAGFDCFVECHRILEPLTASPIHALRAAALRSSNKLLATLDSNGIYRHTVDENADAQSRGAVHATLREVWRAVMAASATHNRAATEPDLWYANGAVAQCTNALIKLDHQSVDTELIAVWGMLERMRDGQLLGRENCESLCGHAKRADAEQAIVHFDNCCTQLVQQIISTYERLYQMLPLLESVLLAIRKGLVKSDTIVTFGVCGALQNTAPLLPCSQLPPIFGSLREHLVQCMKATRGDEPVEEDAVAGAVDAIVAIFVIVLQYCSVDEASSHAVHSELELLNSEVLGPGLLHSEKIKAFKAEADGHGQAVAHLRRAAVALEFRLQYQKPLNEVQSIRPMSVLSTWDSTLTPEQQRMTDDCDLAATCVALQRIAVLHDSMQSSDAESASSRSEQIEECLSYVWRDIDEMQHCSVEGVMNVHTRAKWQQIAANIFLLSKCSSKHVMQKFFSCVVALLSRQEDTPGADSDCMATAHNLVKDHRFCELESFREVGLVVIAARIQQLSSKVGVQPWVTKFLSCLGRPDSATEGDSDELLIKRLDKRATQETAGAKQFCDDEVHLGSSMSGIASVMKFVRSLPTGFFEIKQMLQCVRLAYTVEGFCDAGTSTHCRSACVEARCLLGWSLAIICTSRSNPKVQSAVPLIDAAFRRFLDWPVVVSEDDSCPHMRQYRDAVMNFMRSIATDVLRHDSIQQMLPSAFDIESVQPGSSRWSAFYLTAFLKQANNETEARLRVATGSPRREDKFAAGIARPQLVPTDVVACTAVLEHCTKLMSQLDSTAGINHRCSSTHLRAMAALLDARRIMASSSVGKSGGLLGSELAESVSMAGKLLTLDDVDQDVHQSCLELIAATTRALQLFEPQLSSRNLGCLLAVVFRVHSKISCPQNKQLALKVFEGVVIGAGAEHVELLLLIVQSELTTCTAGDRADLCRVWTAIEVLRVAEASIRSHSLRYKPLLQNHAAGLTQALLHQIYELQYVRTRGKDEAGEAELPWHTVMSAATRSLARLVHYTATSGIREARQTGCLLQIAERTSIALSGCEGSVSLAGVTGVLELLTEMVKMCARDVLQCMPMFISCTRKILTIIWSLSSCSHTDMHAHPGHKELWETAAAQLCSLYELLPKALNASALRRYVPYLLSNYIDAALWHGNHSCSTCIHLTWDIPSSLMLLTKYYIAPLVSGLVCSQHARLVGGHTRSMLPGIRIRADRLRHPLPQPQ